MSQAQRVIDKAAQTIKWVVFLGQMHGVRESEKTDARHLSAWLEGKFLGLEL